jgi:hypothetical protein
VETETRFRFQFLWKRKCVSVSRLSSYGNELLWKRKHVSISNFYGNGNVFPFPDSLELWERIAVETETRFRFCNGNMFWFPFCHLIYGAVPHLRVFRVATEP